MANVEDAAKSTSRIKSDMESVSKSSSETMTNIAAMLDNLLKGVESFNNALKEAQKSLSGGIGTTGVTDKGPSALGTNTEQLAKNLDAMKKSLEGFDSSKALINSFTLLPEAFFQQMEQFNSLAEQSDAAKSFASLHSQLVSGTITLEQYATELTRTVKELKKGEAASKMFSDAIGKSATEAQKKLQDFPANAITGLIDTFSKTIADGGDIADAMSKKLKTLGTQLLDNVINSLLKDLVDGLMKGSFESLGSGLTGMLDGVFSIFSNIFKFLFSAQGNIFGPQGVLPFAHGGVISQPTIFGFAKGIGLMGEAGAEAIMPLGRDSRGNLGVRVADNASSTGGVFAPHVEINVENKGGGDMSEEQARSLGTQVKAIVEMQVAKQMYEYMRNGTLRPSMGRGY